MNVDPCRRDETTRGRSPGRGSSSLPPETPFEVWTLRWAGSISNATLVPRHTTPKSSTCRPRARVLRTFADALTNT